LIQVISYPLRRCLKSIYCVVSHSIYRISLAQPNQAKQRNLSGRSPSTSSRLALDLAWPECECDCEFDPGFLRRRWRQVHTSYDFPLTEVSFVCAREWDAGSGCSLHRNHFYNWHAASQKKNSKRISGGPTNREQTSLNCLRGFFRDLWQRCLQILFVRYDIILIEVTFGLRK